jgi:hypothetical protein
MENCFTVYGAGLYNTLRSLLLSLTVKRLTLIETGLINM